MTRLRTPEGLAVFYVGFAEGPTDAERASIARDVARETGIELDVAYGHVDAAIKGRREFDAALDAEVLKEQEAAIAAEHDPEV